MSIISYLQMCGCFLPYLDGLQGILKAYCDFVEEHKIIFNRTKSLWVLFCCKQFKLSSSPQVRLCNSDISSAKRVKYLGVVINYALCDDDDIARQIRSPYGAANSLNINFCNFSENVKIICSTTIVFRFVRAIFEVGESRDL